MVAYLIAERTSKLGFGVFLATPFMMGFSTSFIMNFAERRTTKSRIGHSLVVLLVSYILLIAFTWEGVACLVMASPIMALLCILGAVVARAAAGHEVRLEALSIAPIFLLFDPALPPELLEPVDAAVPAHHPHARPPPYQTPRRACAAHLRRRRQRRPAGVDEHRERDL